jgi:hypothetical protein
MSLIPCLECGNQVSRSAIACPSCGCPYDEMIGDGPQAPRTNWFGETVVGLLMLVILFTVPALWPLLLLLCVAGTIHVIRKSPGLVPSRYAGKHLAQRSERSEQPLSLLVRRHIVGLLETRPRRTGTGPTAR